MSSRRHRAATKSGLPRRRRPKPGGHTSERTWQMAFTLDFCGRSGCKASLQKGERTWRGAVGGEAAGQRVAENSRTNVLLHILQ